MKKTVFLTGATGTMGWAGLQELLKHDDKLDIVILARHSQKNIEKLKPLQDRIKIVWGDLTNYEDVLKGVTGADYVLHVGGMVSPSADYFPEKTLKVNTTAAANVVKAIQSQPNADDIRAVYIGSVAQTSDRGPDTLWGRTGDPIFSSVYDYYGISKIIAERTFAESGLKHWVSLRQSGILYPAILKQYDPIMFHVPITGVLEWATVEDSGRLLANLCTLDLPDEFWNRFYNISSGPDYRLSNFEFETLLLDAIHCPGPKKIFNANWFVLRNFHGQFYLDADKLEQYLHFRANIPVKDYFRQMGERMPKFFKLAKIVPAPIIKAAMLPMAYKKKYGTQWWLKHNDEQRINAYPTSAAARLGRRSPTGKTSTSTSPRTPPTPSRWTTAMTSRSLWSSSPSRSCARPVPSVAPPCSPPSMTATLKSLWSGNATTGITTVCRPS